MHYQIGMQKKPGPAARAYKRIETVVDGVDVSSNVPHVSIYTLFWGCDSYRTTRRGCVFYFSSSKLQKEDLAQWE
jgi:hypothetical protein